MSCFTGSTLCFGSMVSPPYLVTESKVSTLYLCVLCSDMNSSALGSIGTRTVALLGFSLALSELLAIYRYRYR